MADQRADVTLEQALGQIGDHRAVHVALADGRHVDELAALRAVIDDALLLHLGQHRRDGGQRSALCARQTLEHARHRRFALVPKHAHDRVLQFAQVMGSVHGEPPSRTRVADQLPR
jgi:hypothetical protein